MGFGIGLTIAIGPSGAALGGPSSTAPANTAVPVVTGATVSGDTLTASTGSWTNSPTGYSYQWKSGGTNVGTNSNSYTLQTSDVGNTVTCTVTATNAGGSNSATGAPVGPVTGSGGGAALNFSVASNSMYIGAIV